MFSIDSIRSNVDVFRLHTDPWEGHCACAFQGPLPCMGVHGGFAQKCQAFNDLKQAIRPCAANYHPESMAHAQFSNVGSSEPF